MDFFLNNWGNDQLFKYLIYHFVQLNIYIDQS